MRKKNIHTKIVNIFYLSMFIGICFSFSNSRAIKIKIIIYNNSVAIFIPNTLLSVNGLIIIIYPKIKIDIIKKLIIKIYGKLCNTTISRPNKNFRPM